MATKFYKCNHCGNVVEKVVDSKVPVDRIEEIYLNTKEEIIHELLMDKEFDNSEYTI